MTLKKKRKWTFCLYEIRKACVSGHKNENDSSKTLNKSKKSILVQVKVFSSTCTGPMKDHLDQPLRIPTLQTSREDHPCQTKGHCRTAPNFPTNKKRGQILSIRKVWVPGLFGDIFDQGSMQLPKRSKSARGKTAKK